ncbi:MAG: hypothetical protein ACE5IH_04175 [Thermodesulfobacteriota bacterium]
MSSCKWYKTIVIFCSVGFLSLSSPILTTAANPSGQDEESMLYMKCAPPPDYKFKPYKDSSLAVEIDIPDIWTPEYDKGILKFVGPDKVDCVDAGTLDYKEIRGFVPGKPYTLEEGKEFFSQQWMKPRELTANMKLLKTEQGYSAIYSADDFVGIAGIKLPEHKKPLLLVIFAQLDGADIEKRMLHMLNTLKYIKP